MDINKDFQLFERERQRILEAYARRSRNSLGMGGYFELEDSAHLLRIQQRYRITQQMLIDLGINTLRGRRVLDIGCGDGTMLLEFLQWGGEPDKMAGIDLREEPLKRARILLPEADIRQSCATDLPWPNNFFNIVSLHTVLSSILDPAMRKQVAMQATNVIKPGGVVVLYDRYRDNPGNPDIKGVFVKEIRNLFPNFRIKLRPVTFLPHFARKVPPKLLGPFYSILTSIPRLCTHHLIVLLKDFG